MPSDFTIGLQRSAGSGDLRKSKRPSAASTLKAPRPTQVLDDAASQSRRRRWPLNIGIFWQDMEWRRAQLCRQLGRHAEAEEIEATLRHLLTYADPDHRIRIGLEQLRSSAREVEAVVSP